MTYISLFLCFLYIKKWRWPGVSVPHWPLALVFFCLNKNRDGSNDGSQNIFFIEKYGLLSLNYPRYPFLSGALIYGHLAMWSPVQLTTSFSVRFCNLNRWLLLLITQGCHSQGKSLENEMNYFPGHGKVREFYMSQGNLEKSGKSQRISKFPLKWYD